MELESALLGEIQLALVALFGEQPFPTAQIEKTKPIFQGDYTLVVFPYLKISQQNPENTAEIIGQYLQNHSTLVSEYNVIKGFLNIVVNPNVWMQFHQDHWNHSPFASFPSGEIKSWWNILPQIPTNPYTSDISEITYSVIASPKY